MAVNMTDDVQKGMEALVNCTICTEPFTEPKVLPCQHTFCLRCLHQFFDCYNQQRIIKMTNFPCPACRKIVYLSQGGIDKLPNDFKVGQIQDFLNKVGIASKSRSDICDICKYDKKQKDAKHFCVHCSKYLCEQCMEHHQQSTLFQSHSVMSIASTDISVLECKEHNEEIKYFCIPCSLALCTVCALGRHSKHETIDVSSALDQKRQVIADLVNDARQLTQQFEEKAQELESLKQSRERHFNNTQADIKRQAEEVIDSVREQETELLKQLEKSHNDAMKLVQRDAEQIRTQSTNMVTWIDSSNELLQPTKSLQLLAAQQQLISKMTKLTGTSLPSASEKVREGPKFIPGSEASIGELEMCSLAAEQAEVKEAELKEDPQRREGKPQHKVSELLKDESDEVKREQQSTSPRWHRGYDGTGGRQSPAPPSEAVNSYRQSRMTYSERSDSQSPAPPTDASITQRQSRISSESSRRQSPAPPGDEISSQRPSRSASSSDLPAAPPSDLSNSHRQSRTRSESSNGQAAAPPTDVNSSSRQSRISSQPPAPPGDKSPSFKSPGPADDDNPLRRLLFSSRSENKLRKPPAPPRSHSPLRRPAAPPSPNSPKPKESPGGETRHRASMPSISETYPVNGRCKSPETPREEVTSRRPIGGATGKRTSLLGRSLSMKEIRNTTMISPEQKAGSAIRRSTRNIILERSQTQPQKHTAKLKWRTDEYCGTRGVAFTPDGLVVTAEHEDTSHKIEVFDSSGEIKKWMMGGTATVVKPWGITVNNQTSAIIVTDHGDSSVKVLDSSLTVLNIWKLHFSKPCGIAVMRTGDFVISDIGDRAFKLTIHTPSGLRIQEFGAHGGSDGHLLRPQYVAVDHHDRILVSDCDANCIKIFDRSGKQLTKFTNMDDSRLNMYPQGLCVDATNHILVADQSYSGVSMYSSDGKFIQHMVKVDSPPWGVAIHPDTGLMAIGTDPSLRLYDTS